MNFRNHRVPKVASFQHPTAMKLMTTKVTSSREQLPVAIGPALTKNILKVKEYQGNTKKKILDLLVYLKSVWVASRRNKKRRSA